jgi:hypothetical protein
MKMNVDAKAEQQVKFRRDWLVFSRERRGADLATICVRARSTTRTGRARNPSHKSARHDAKRVE